MRIDIFTRLLVALLLVALLPLTAFWQFERQRMIERGATEAQQRLDLFSDRVIQQVDDWSRLNISVMQVAAGQSGMRLARLQRTSRGYGYPLRSRRLRGCRRLPCRFRHERESASSTFPRHSPD